MSAERRSLLSTQEPKIVDSDMANAARFRTRMIGHAFYTPERGWLLWDGKRYAVDDGGIILAHCKEVALDIFDEVKYSPQQATLSKWARQSQGLERLRAMEFLARTEPGIMAGFAEFDRDPLLLNCNNGTVNLRTGELRPHDPTDMLTRLVPIDYDPNADFKLWDKVLMRALDNDAGMVDYLQRAFGYSLTGDTGEQCFFLLLGNGANSKTVILETLKYLSGEYGLNANTETITLNRGNAINNDVARLAGARLVTINETIEGARINEPLLKDLVGGDTITARFLHREYFDFRPTFKIWQRGNHRPVIRGTDYGIWRRIHLIEFRVQIPEAERDPHLIDKLKAEAPGILTWSVRGAMVWQKQGLQPPERVRAATRAYREDSDLIGNFLNERCTLQNDIKARASLLHQDYSKWCDQNGYHPLNAKNFGAALTERGFSKARDNQGRTLYIGIGLRDLVRSEGSEQSEGVSTISLYRESTKINKKTASDHSDGSDRFDV